jgi:chromosome transmission fidelity protein 18
MRPIICICNDLYAPALRPLREAAEVVEVLPPQPRMLQARLREVCNREDAAVQETVRCLESLPHTLMLPSAV